MTAQGLREFRLCGTLVPRSPHIPSLFAPRRMPLRKIPSHRTGGALCISFPEQWDPTECSDAGNSVTVPDAIALLHEIDAIPEAFILSNGFGTIVSNDNVVDRIYASCLKQP